MISETVAGLNSVMPWKPDNKLHQNVSERCDQNMTLGRHKI